MNRDKWTESPPAHSAAPLRNLSFYYIFITIIHRLKSQFGNRNLKNVCEAQLLLQLALGLPGWSFFVLGFQLERSVFGCQIGSDRVRLGWAFMKYLSVKLIYPYSSYSDPLTRYNIVKWIPLCLFSLGL